MRFPPSRRTAAVAAAVALTTASGAVLAAGGSGGSEPSPSGATGPDATTRVTQGDLIDTKTVTGTLGYGAEQTLTNGASGTVTWTRPDGVAVGRGQVLYRVDNRPVTLMYGSVPIYRELSAGVDDGPDVRQLERNLRALGYGDDLTVDRHFDAATAAAVSDWQDDCGLPETGSVDAAQVVFAPGAVRITDTKVTKGGKARPGSAGLTVTGTDRRVEVDLDTTDQQFARKGAKVTVGLPGGARVDGRLVAVGTVARTKGEPDDQGTVDATIKIEIALSDPGRVRTLDRAPVSVDLESERHRNVLSVPVEVLLALREGGFGVQLVEGGTARIVAVRLGLFARGRVEISAPGLRAGSVVGVPAK
ncbi:peptidoglycan-binding protein [Spirillospora sp. CA-294931]|uniref:peptidoglycan-binding protein n=1 Tax=Spirillospora sp. CA-294931 TaxID=3240042 RepID=UPI003D8E0E3C